MTLPALFYRILAKTPFEQLNNVPFIATATLGTFSVLMLSLGIAYLIRRDLAEAAIAQLAGAYGNIGYMGPGLALATVGAQAAAPVALIFCFETLLFFSVVPFLMALARPLGKGFGATALDVVRRIALHPLMVASALGALLGRAALRAAGRDRQAAAVSLQRLGAVRAVHARRHGGAAAAQRRAVGRAHPGADQARAASHRGAAAAHHVRPVRSDLGRRPQC